MASKNIRLFSASGIFLSANAFAAVSSLYKIVQFRLRLHGLDPLERCIRPFERVSFSRFPDGQPARLAVCSVGFRALGKLNAKRPGLARYVIFIRDAQRLFAFADELLFSLFQAVLDIIAEAGTVTAE